LLQNAEDAGATEASARVEEGALVFCHNGADFSERDFASLCSFADSNKRHLHTIGFRGIGFKSCFSLGDQVFLTSPTLSVRFDRGRFFVPVVTARRSVRPGFTEIRVPIGNQALTDAARGYIAEWARSPTALLFFSKIRLLDLQGSSVGYDVIGEGPVPNSRRVRIHGAQGEALHIRGVPVHPPPEVIAEIKTVRGDSRFDVTELSVSVVLETSKSRLFVVLPTDHHLDLPFSINGPFLLAPDRSSVKAPSVSPTNAWLLAEVGRLVGESLIRWLQSPGTIASRSEAYSLLPSQSGHDEPGGRLASYVTARLEKALQGQSVTLCNDGKLRSGQGVLALPQPLTEVWEAGEAVKLFGDGETALLCSEANTSSRRAVLEEWALVRSVSDDEVVDRLRARPVPDPGAAGLTSLWLWLFTAVQDRFWDPSWRSVRCVPVAGLPTLFAPAELLVIGDPPTGVGAEDWRFLESIVRIAVPFWLDPSGRTDTERERLIGLARVLGLDKETPVAGLLEAAAETVSRTDSADLLRLGRIAGVAGIRLPDRFPWLLASGDVREAGEDLLGPLDPLVEDLLPPEWTATRRIADAYVDQLGVDDARKWMAWAQSPASRLLPFPMPDPFETTIFDRDDAVSWLRSRGVPLPSSPDARPPFTVHDFRFGVELMDYWAADAAEGRWPEITRGVLALPAKRREEVLQAKLLRSKRPLCRAPAEWVVELRRRPCLRDDRGVPARPGDLLVRTTETEALGRAARFVERALDTNDNRSTLLALGVRDKPSHSDVEGIVGRLRSLSTATKPPVRDLIGLYEALDQAVGFLRSAELAATSRCFREEPLILSEEGTWQCSPAIARANPLAVSGAVTVLDAVANLGLWRKLGVPEEPDRGHLAVWLGGLPLGQQLDAKDLRRARQVLASVDVWGPQQRWLAADGSLRPVEALRYHSKAPGGLPRLFPHVAATVADASMLAGSAIGGPLSLPRIEERLSSQVASAPSARPDTPPAWFVSLRRCVTRLSISDDVRAKVGTTLIRLAGSRWYHAHELLVGVFADGVPVGPEQTAMAAWSGEIVYVVGSSTRHHNSLKAELSRPFDAYPTLAQVIGECVGREADWVEEYLENECGLGSDFAEHPSVEADAFDLQLVPLTDGGLPSGSAAALPERAQPLQAQCPTRSLRTRVAVLGGGGGRVQQHQGRAGESSWGGWREVCAAYLRKSGFVEVDGGFAAPDGRRAELLGGQLHYRVLDANGTLAEQGHVLPAGLLDGEPTEILAEVWLALKSRADLSYLLFLHADGGISRSAFDGFSRLIEVSPAAYRLSVRVGQRSHEAAG